MDQIVNYAAIDPELVTAIDVYLQNLRMRMLQRVEKADQEYKGRWKGLSERQLREYFEEEVTDEHVYKAMYAWRFGSESRDHLS